MNDKLETICITVFGIVLVVGLCLLIGGMVHRAQDNGNHQRLACLDKAQNDLAVLACKGVLT